MYCSSGNPETSDRPSAHAHSTSSAPPSSATTSSMPSGQPLLAHSPVSATHIKEEEVEASVQKSLTASTTPKGDSPCPVCSTSQHPAHAQPGSVSEAEWLRNKEDKKHSSKCKNMLTCTPASGDKEDNTGSDQLDDDLLLSEDDSMPNLIITNVCSIREEDADFGEEIGGGDTASSDSGPTSQSRSVSSANKQVFSEVLDSESPQVVSGLATSQLRGPSDEGLLAQDVFSVPALVPPVRPTPATIPSLSVPQSAGPCSVSSTTVLPTAADSSALRNGAASASALQNSTRFIRDAVVRSSTGDARQLSGETSRDQTVPEVHPVAGTGTGQMPHHPKQGTPETSAGAMAIKPEPMDIGYETVPGVAPTASACPSSGSSSGASPSPDTEAPASKSNNRKRPLSETAEGQESTTGVGDDQQKRLRQRTAQASACSSSAEAQGKGKPDAVSATNNNGVGAGQHAMPPATHGATAAGPVTALSTPSGLTVLSKPLVVPSSCTAKKPPSTQQHNVPRKSVLLNLPPTLSLSRTSASQPATSGPTTGTGKNTRCLPSENAGEASATAVATKDQQLNEQIVAHLRRMQEKPGSEQMLTIPMPDGSTHSVKVVFTPRLKPQTSIVTSNAPQSMSSTTNASESGPIPTSTNLSSPAVVMTSSHTMPISLTQATRPNVASSTPASYTLVSSGRPVVRQMTSLLLPHSAADQVPATTTGNNPISSSPTVTVRSSSHPLLSHTLVVKTTTAASPATTKPTQQVAQGAPPSAPTTREPPAPGSKCDVRLDQVSAEAKLSAADMAALIQGKNLVPLLEPRRRPGNSGVPSKVYRCVECGVMCSTLVGYTVHVKRMSMVIRYACMVCKAALVFFNKCTFLAHLRRHTATDSANGQVLNLKSYTMSVSSLPDELLPPIGKVCFLVTSQRASAPYRPKGLGFLVTSLPQPASSSSSTPFC